MGHIIQAYTYLDQIAFSLDLKVRYAETVELLIDADLTDARSIQKWKKNAETALMLLFGAASKNPDALNLWKEARKELRSIQ